MKKQHLLNIFSFKDSEEPFINYFINQWQNLLDQNLPERVYHSFIEEYAGLFFGSVYPTFQVVSKFRLGGELECDFLVIKDGYSNGTKYELIEIEKPSSKLYTSDGIPSKDFNTALQQIKDWRRFLTEDKSFVKKYLPTTSTRVIHDSNISFKIILGRRKDCTPLDIEKRIEESSTSKVEIRSFDSLTDHLLSADYKEYTLGELYLTHIPYTMNPFFKALKDSEWRKACLEKKFPTFHVFERATHFFDYKKQVNHLRTDFEKYCMDE